MRRQRKVHLGITDDFFQLADELTKRRRFATALREALKSLLADPSEPPKPEEPGRIISTTVVILPEDLYVRADQLGQIWNVPTAVVLREALRRYANGSPEGGETDAEER